MHKGDQWILFPVSVQITSHLSRLVEIFWGSDNLVVLPQTDLSPCNGLNNSPYNWVGCHHIRVFFHCSCGDSQIVFLPKVISGSTKKMPPFFGFTLRQIPDWTKKSKQPNSWKATLLPGTHKTQQPPLNILKGNLTKSTAKHRGKIEA